MAKKKKKNKKSGKKSTAGQEDTISVGKGDQDAQNNAILASNHQNIINIDLSSHGDDGLLHCAEYVQPGAMRRVLGVGGKPQKLLQMLFESEHPNRAKQIAELQKSTDPNQLNNANMQMYIKPDIMRDGDSEMDHSFPPLELTAPRSRDIFEDEDNKYELKTPLREKVVKDLQSRLIDHSYEKTEKETIPDTHPGLYSEFSFPSTLNMEEQLNMIRKHIGFEFTPEDTPMTDTESALRFAVCGDVQAMEELSLSSLKAKDKKWGMTPLMAAAAAGAMLSVSHLVDAGVDLDAQDKHGWTALMMAVRNGHYQVAEQLVLKGANPSHKNKFGDTVYNMGNRAMTKRIIDGTLAGNRTIDG